MAIIKKSLRNSEISESSMQDILYGELRACNHFPIAPNVCAYGWESDMLSVLKSGYINEYEIKISLSDFRADAKKSGKHELLRTGMRSPTECEQSWIDRMIENGWEIPYKNYDKLLCKFKELRPNYFWYVCPQDLIPINEVPEYAGLIYVCNDRWRLSKVKTAPRLHTEKVSEKIKNSIMTSLAWRYWNIRLAK